jgi:hypothetical protein
MSTTFGAAMAKLAVLGQDVKKMVDCSEVIPVPKPFTGKAMFPAGLGRQDVEQAVCISCCLLEIFILIDQIFSAKLLLSRRSRPLQAQ